MGRKVATGCGAGGGLPFDACLRLLRVARDIQGHFAHYLEGLGLSLAHFDVLVTLEPCDGLNQQELAGRLAVTKGNVVWLVDRLSERGLVERRDDPDDRRAYRLQLTEPGRSLVRRALPGQRELILRIMGTLTVEEQQAFDSSLRKVEAGIADRPP